MSSSGFEPPRSGDQPPTGPGHPAEPIDNAWWAQPPTSQHPTSQQRTSHQPSQPSYAAAPGAPVAEQLPQDQIKQPPSRQRWPVGMGTVAGASVASALLASALTVGGMSLTKDDSTSPLDTAAPPPAVSVPSRPDGAVDWAAVARKASPSVVNIKVVNSTASAGGTGSGTVFDQQGHILTNAHVADAGGTTARMSIVATDGRVFTDVKLVGEDRSSDLAVLKINNPPNNLAPITMGDSSAVAPGQPVMALGSPLGLADTVTTGIVSAINRPVVAQDTARPSADTVITNAIQTDAAINPGNSGGALVNSSGEMIGIPSSINTLAGSSGQGGSIGLGFAIPANEAARIAKELIATGKASHAWLGVSLTNGSASSGGVTRMGAKISSVSPSTPAAQAGLAAGDVVVSIDGIPTTSADGLTAQIRQRAPGDRVKLSVVRGNQVKTMDVALARRSN